MIVAFSHDHTFLKSSGFYYSYGSYPEGYWSRYLDFCSKVYVFAKERNSDAVEATGYIKSFPDDSSSNIKMLGVKKIPYIWRLGISSGKNWEDYEKKLSNIDFAVCRIPSDLGYLLASFCCKKKIPYSLEIVGEIYGAYYSSGNIKGKLYAPFAEWKAKKIIKKAAGVLYVSKKLSLMYPASGKAEVVVATNAVISNISNNFDIERRVERLYDKKYIPKLGVTGSYFVNYKGIDLAILALATLVKKGYFFKLHVLGGGHVDKYIELAKSLNVEELVSFDGLLPAGEPVRNWLLDCDYYIQPSRQEGLPRGLLEAMSTGLPCVGSTAGAIPDLLPPAYIHKVGDYQDLSEKIIAMFDSDYSEMANYSLKIASSYHYDIVNSERKKFYKKVFHWNKL